MTFVLPKANMGFYDDAGRYLLEDGEFHLCAGGSWQCRMLADEAADIIISGSKGRTLGILFGALSDTIIDKIIAALKMHSLINDTIKGVILIAAILVQTAGPQLKKRLPRHK